MSKQYNGAYVRVTHTVSEWSVKAVCGRGRPFIKAIGRMSGGRAYAGAACSMIGG